MDSSVYQELANSTDLTPNDLLCHVLGLAGEVGEILNYLTPKDKDLFDAIVNAQSALAHLQNYKRQIRDEGKSFSFAYSDGDKIAKEVQDCTWHIAAIFTDLEKDMNTELQDNLTRLADRKKRDVIKGSGDTR